MIKIKYLILFFAMLCCFIQHAAEFSMKVTPDKRCYKLNESVYFTLDVDIPDGYQLSAWYLVISQSGSPAGYTQKWDEWGSARVGDIKWIPNAAPNKKSIRAGFNLKGFIPGDYNFSIVSIIYNTRKNEDPKLVSEYMHLTLEAPRTEVRAIIDGKANEKFWKNEVFVKDFKKLGTSEKAEAQTRFKTHCDGKNLYFYIECDEPFMDCLIQNKMNNGNTSIWLNDSVELKFTNDESLQYFYQVIVDCNGTYAGNKMVDRNTGGRSYAASGEWNAMAKTAVVRKDNQWVLEISIPLGVLDVNSKTNSNWRLDVGRNRYAIAKKKGIATIFTNAELSSGGTYSERGHGAVWEYPVYKVKNYNTDRFLFNLESVRNKITKADNGDLVCTTKANLFSAAANSNCFRIKTYFTSPDGKVMGKNIQMNGIRGKKHTPVTFTTTCKIPGNYRYHIEFWSNESKPVLLKSYISDMEVYYAPFKAVLKRPAYRNNIYATMPDKNIEVQIAVPKNTGKPLAVELLNEAGVVVMDKKITSAVSENKIILDAANIPDGRYTLQISMTENGHNFKENIKLRKLPYRDGEVWFDASGACFVDGKPFIPIGWYIVEATNTLGKYENSYIHPSLHVRDMTDFNQIMDTLWASKRKGILNPYYQLNGQRETDGNFAFMDSGKVRSMSKEQIELLRKAVSEMGKHPGVLAWYMADEPEGNIISPEWLAQAKAVVEEADPYHPCTMTNFSNEGMVKFSDGGDVMMPDCYPGYFEKIYTQRPMDTTLRMRAAKKIGKPSWLILPGTLFPANLASDTSIRGIPPSYEDLRHQTIEAALQDCKGFLFYAPMDGLRYSSLIVGLPALCDQIGALTDYLIKDTTEIKSSVTPAETMFFTGMKENGQEFCVMSANATFKELKIEYTLPNKFNGTLYNAGATRSFTVKDGKFTDTIGGRKTRIYMTNRKLAESMQSTEAVEKQIIQHRNDRKQPGNLLATGEILMADQVLYNNQPERRPAHIPGIKASSEWGNFYTTTYLNLNCGTLYNTIDGIRRPTRHEFCWIPAYSKDAYIQYELPKASPVKELHIYTPYGNLREMVIVTDSKRYPFSNPEKKDLLIIPLSGETTKTVKIEVTKYEYQLYDVHLGTNSCIGVISEVELY